MGIAQLIIRSNFILRNAILTGEGARSHCCHLLKFLLNLFYSLLELTKLVVVHNIAFICYYYSNANNFFVKRRNN